MLKLDNVSMVRGRAVTLKAELAPSRIGLQKVAGNEVDR